MNHLTYEYNKRLKLYINVKQNSPTNLIFTRGRFPENKSEYNKSQSSICEAKNENNELRNEKNVIKDIINCLLDCLSTNKNGCVITFTTYDNSDNCTINVAKGNKNVEPLRNIYLENIIEQFFVKLNESILKKHESIHLMIRYSILDFYSIHDILEEYEPKKNFQKIKSCVLKTYNSKTNITRNVPTKLSTELSKWKNRTNSVKVLNLEKLRDILNYAKTKKIPLENNMKNNKYPCYTLITIEIIRKNNKNSTAQNKNEMDPMNFIINDNKTLNTFYFFSVCSDNSTNHKENMGNEDLRKVHFEIQHILESYVNLKLIRDTSHFSSISKICNEICSDVIKILLYEELNKQEVSNLEGTMVDTLCKNNSKLNNCVTSFLMHKESVIMNKPHPIIAINNPFENNKKQNNEKGLVPSTTPLDLSSSNIKEEIIPKDEKYYNIEKVLFENIDMEESEKYEVIKKALLLPTELFEYFSLLNKTFQYNYESYKQREQKLRTEILNLVEKQNEIMKNYEQEENRKKREMNELLEEIRYMIRKNTEIKNEIDRHEKMSLKISEKEQMNEKEDLKRLHTIDKALTREYESFSKFRKDSLIDFERMKSKKGNISNINDTGMNKQKPFEFNEIIKTFDEEHLKNMLESQEYSERVFTQMHDLKVTCDGIINKKVTHFKLLKDTVQKLNEKINSLRYDCRNVTDIKLIHPIEDRFLNFDEHEKQYEFINEIKDLQMAIHEFDKSEFNNTQLSWLHKIHGICKNF